MKTPITRAFAKTVLVLTVALGTTLTAAPAQAASYYGDTSRQVAKRLGCKHFDGNGGGGTVYRSGVCYLNGRRVNVITFKSRTQQRTWNTMAKDAFGPGFYWGNGRGALIVAKNGNRPAAALGARRLPGRLVHG